MINGLMKEAHLISLHAAYNLATRGDESKREIKPLRFFFTEQEARNFIHSYKIGDRFLDRYI
jgi:hypothetical protein